MTNFLFKHQLLKFCNSFVPVFENLHNLIHLNDISDTNTIFDDSSIGISENSKRCEDTPLSNVQDNEAKMCDDQFKGKFVCKNVINLPKQNLTENDISLLSKGLNFTPTCNMVDVARLKLQLEQFGRMLCLKWHFRKIRQIFLLTYLKQNPLLALGRRTTEYVVILFVYRWR